MSDDLRMLKQAILRSKNEPAEHPSNKITLETLEANFTYHPPTEETKAKYAKINEAAKALARVVLETAPDCVMRSAALRHIMQVRMEANAAIACAPPPGPPGPLEPGRFAREQATNCAGCGKYTHTPCRMDGEFGGYVCGGCMEKRIHELRALVSAPAGRVPPASRENALLRDFAEAPPTHAVERRSARWEVLQAAVRDPEGWTILGQELGAAALASTLHPFTPSLELRLARPEEAIRPFSVHRELPDFRSLEDVERFQEALTAELQGLLHDARGVVLNSFMATPFDTRSSLRSEGWRFSGLKIVAADASAGGLDGRAASGETERSKT